MTLHSVKENNIDVVRPTHRSCEGMERLGRYLEEAAEGRLLARMV